MYDPVCRMVYIKDYLVLIGSSRACQTLKFYETLSKFYYFIFINSLTLILAARLNCSQSTCKFGLSKQNKYFGFVFNRLLMLLDCFKISIAPFLPSRPETLDWVASLWSRGGCA